MDTVEADLRKFKLADLILLHFWVVIPGFLTQDKIFNQAVSFVKNDTLFETQTL